MVQEFVLTHPFHDGAVKWMGHPAFVGSLGGFGFQKAEGFVEGFVAFG